MYCGGLRSAMASSAASCYDVGGGVAGGGHLSVHNHHHQGPGSSIVSHCPPTTNVVDMDCWTNGVGQLQMASMVVRESVVLFCSASVQHAVGINVTVRQHLKFFTINRRSLKMLFVVESDLIRQLGTLEFFRPISVERP
jgi:hypothetical protein